MRNGIPYDAFTVHCYSTTLTCVYNIRMEGWAGSGALGLTLERYGVLKKLRQYLGALNS